MKVVILAGGLGTRLSEETVLKPKPMVTIGDKPILWHIMKIYSAHGLNDFIICCGYKGHIIKEYFCNYNMYNADLTIDLKNGTHEIHNNFSEPWKVTLVDTGLHTMTGGRIKRIHDFLGNEDFCLTYGDGLGDVNISKLLDFHRNHDKLATLTSVAPPGKFGSLHIEATQVTKFIEKPADNMSWINGGFFVLSPKLINYIDGDQTSWEREPLENIAKDGELMSFKHRGFWHPMDSLSNKVYLESLWNSGNAPWKIW